MGSSTEHHRVPFKVEAWEGDDRWEYAKGFEGGAPREPLKSWFIYRRKFADAQHADDVRTRAITQAVIDIYASSPTVAGLGEWEHTGWKYMGDALDDWPNAALGYEAFVKGDMIVYAVNESKYQAGGGWELSFLAYTEQWLNTFCHDWEIDVTTISRNARVSQTW